MHHYNSSAQCSGLDSAEDRPHHDLLLAIRAQVIERVSEERNLSHGEHRAVLVVGVVPSRAAQDRAILNDVGLDADLAESEEAAGHGRDGVTVVVDPLEVRDLNEGKSVFVIRASV
jgi:hypothetical protein